MEAITGLQSRLPFPLLGLDTDNDSVFLNDTLLGYCQQQGITFTRSRAYQKNDQEWVEQKNGSIVRKLIGEVGPTHRRDPKPGRWWRTRLDPFAEVWPVLLGWLEERPDLEAKEMLKRLQASGYGSFTDGQLRTLERRVRLWRTQIVKQLVYGTDPPAAQTVDLSSVYTLDADRPRMIRPQLAQRSVPWFATLPYD